MADNGYANAVLVTTDWLAGHLGDEGLVVAEVDENPDLYDEGHIPGAVKLHWRDDLQDPVERDVVDRATFEELLGARGIGNSTTVVLYGDKNNWFAAYAYWYLKVYGHGDVRILDGGRQKWIDEGRELTEDVPSPAPQTYTASDRDESIRAYRDQVREWVDGADVALVDVRSPGEYAGDLVAPPFSACKTAATGPSGPGTYRPRSLFRGRARYATTGRSSRRTSCESSTAARESPPNAP